MALMVERIVDGGVHTEEALGGRCRLEPLHLALSPSHDSVGVSAQLFLRSRLWSSWAATPALSGSKASLLSR